MKGISVKDVKYPAWHRLRHRINQPLAFLWFRLRKGQGMKTVYSAVDILLAMIGAAAMGALSEHFWHWFPHL